MSNSPERPAGAVADGHRVLWFVPERPVEGNTLFTTPAHAESTDSIERDEGDHFAAS